MKRTFFALTVVLALVAAALAQNPSATSTGTSPEGRPQGQPPASNQTAAPQQPNQLPAGVVIPAELSKSLDAKKAKSGDKIEAKTTMDLLSHGQVVVPRNTKIVGRVIEAKPHSKESPDSMVGIVFDRLTMKDGRELQMQAAVQAIGRPLQSLPTAGGPGPAAGGGGMGPPPTSSAPGGQGNSTATGGRSDTMGSPSSYPSGNTSGLPTDSSGSGGSASALDPHSQGVIGMQGLSLKSSAQSSVVSSNTENVHLDGGTQLILKTQ